MTNANSTLPAFPDEVVTETKIHYVDLPGGAGRAALLTLDNGRDHKRPNTFGPASLASLETALDTVATRDDLVAVCLTGKPFIFSVGADLSVFRQLTSHEQVLEIGRLGHRVFNKLATLPVPSFAFINGASMGGGLEVALHCTYRTVSAAAPAIALPEVFLGLIPGWGGTALLPRIAGLDNAITVILENPLNNNRMLKPAQAVELGVADAVVESADFIEQSLAWAAAVVTNEIAVERPTTTDEEATRAMARAESLVTARTKGVPPAPRRALDLLAQSRGSLDEIFAAEDQALADLTLSPELAASLYAFDLVQKRAKRPVGVPDVDAGAGHVCRCRRRRADGPTARHTRGGANGRPRAPGRRRRRRRPRVRASAMTADLEARTAKKRLRPDGRQQVCSS